MENQLKTLYYSIEISSPPATVHNKMLNPENYLKWTKPFSPNSTFRGDWSEKSNVYFISKDEEGHEIGMIAQVDCNILGELIVLRHIGMFNKDGESFAGEHIDSWKHCLEVYRFRKTESGTLLICSIEVDTNEHEAYFEKLWPESLNILKSICEII